jgi:ADP-ribosyl-[dinitrogen reductase] hydrolase
LRAGEEAGGGAQIGGRRDSARDRSIGALVGLAVGDALGAPAEGLARDAYARITEFGPSAGHGIDAGAWTDDTGMALCLAESLLAHGRVEDGDLMRRFLGWYRAGGVGASLTTRAVLEDFERTGRLDAAAERRNAGNGCIMRLAPVAIRYRADPAAAREAAIAQARLTHGADEAVAASALFADLLVAALGTGTLGEAAVAQPGLEHIAAGAYRSLERDAVSSAPRAVDTLEAALWCVAGTETFEAAVIEAVNLGGDTDTIGAVAGQLAGALYGAASIPARWVEGLQEAPHLAALAARLHDAGSRI